MCDFLRMLLPGIATSSRVSTLGSTEETMTRQKDDVDTIGLPTIRRETIEGLKDNNLKCITLDSKLNEISRSFTLAGRAETAFKLL